MQASAVTCPECDIQPFALFGGANSRTRKAKKGVSCPCKYLTSNSSIFSKMTKKYAMSFV
jgi:hypothetical protein